MYGAFSVQGKGEKRTFDKDYMCLKSVVKAVWHVSMPK
ncbi:hypothetical protein N473_20700 [Pseudoalteromonas luteoviolacea CPMOR-1]|uniref:Uncharacterized protein n=1 Tax=Pseudoalteromonas luteoviolacea CPMOR-1 TaxID=1365248 RepID=A0A167K162_9GAMM|nr:hypothetical protein N473_20700 [Pseudoalteromonas luteoviolacea CPMOR-1]